MAILAFLSLGPVDTNVTDWPMSFSSLVYHHTGRTPKTAIRTLMVLAFRSPKDLVATWWLRWRPWTISKTGRCFRWERPLGWHKNGNAFLTWAVRDWTKNITYNSHVLRPALGGIKALSLLMTTTCILFFLLCKLSKHRTDRPMRLLALRGTKSLSIATCRFERVSRFKNIICSYHGNSEFSRKTAYLW